MQKDSKPGDNLIACGEHIDVNYDMFCDVCGNELPFSDYIERKSVEAVADDSSVVKVTGNMPEDTSLQTTVISKDDATSMAQSYLPDITSGDVLVAYDISMASNTMEYQPGDYNQVVKVNISNLDLEINDTVALLHIIDDKNYEILPLSSVNGNEIEFKATRFSPYILIYVDTYTITFSGDANFELRTTEGTAIISGDIFDEEKVVDGVTVPAGTNFNFVVTPKEGYGVTDVILVDASTETSGDNYMEVSGGVLGKTGKINKVSQDLVIEVTTVLAPSVTAQPQTTKAIVGTNAEFTVSAENATTFTWQYRENEDDYWKDVTSSIGTGVASGDTSTLTTAPVTYSMSGYEYRCLIGNDNFTIDERVKSDIVLLVVTQSPAMAGETPIVLVQPQNQKVIGGNKATFEITAIGSNLTFTWQYRENEDDYWKAATSLGASATSDVGIDGITKKSTFITNVTTYEMTGYDIRCVVGNDFYYGDLGVKSNIVSLIVTNGGDAKNVQYLDLGFLSDIESQKVKLGNIATFTAETKYADTFRWQYRASGDAYWEDVDSTLGTGYDTATLEIDTSSITLDNDSLELTNNISGYEFRCIISNSAVPTYEKTSNVAFLVVAQDTLTLDVVYDEPKIDLTPLSGDSTSEITLAWTMQSGIRYALYYFNSTGALTLLSDNVVTPYTHTGLESNTTYEYVIYGFDDSDTSYKAVGTAVASTNYDDIYDIINKDTVKPILDNITVTPATGNISSISEVVITFNVTDDNYDAINGSLLYPDDIEVLIDGMNATTAIRDLTKAEIPSGERFTLTINNIWGNGDLSVKIPANSIKDLAKNGNDEYIINTGLSVLRSLVEPITNFSATSGDSPNSIIVTWTDTENTEDVTYVLEVSSGDNNWKTLSGDATSPYVHGNLTKNMSFEYRMKVVSDEGDESEYVYTIGRTEYDPIYGDVMIDTVNPVIELVSVSPDMDYIGATQEITLTFESYDQNYNTDMTLLTADKFIVKTGGTELEGVQRKLTTEDIPSGERFTLTLSNITGTGALVIGVPAEIIFDSALNPNIEEDYSTDVIAMNGETITDAAPTLVPDVHTITVSTNQVNTIPIEKIIYEYRVSGDEDFIVWGETTDKTIVIENLSSNTDYEVRTTMIDVAQNSVTSQSAFTTTKKIDATTLISISHTPTNWTNQDVTATIEWNDTTYIHQYSTDNTDWKTVTGTTTTIADISENVTIYARVSDGVGHSDPIEHEIDNIDKIKPTIGKVDIPEGKANTKTITVSEIADEGGSKVKGYYVSDVADLTNATWTDLGNTSFTFVATEATNYYVWVIDNAGNISEPATASVKDVVDVVSNVEFPTEFEVDVFETKTPELTYEGEAANIEYTIADSSLADIDPATGAITGKASGETTVTVTITNYDGTKEEHTTTLKINAIEPTIVLDKTTLDFVYGDTSKVINITTLETNGDLSVSSSNEDVAKATLTDKVITVTPIGEGTATITLKAEETLQYLGKEIDITINITPRVIEVTWGEDEFTYDENEKEITATINNIVSGDTVNITYSGNKETNAGNYTAEIIGLSNSNYTLDGANNLTHNWVINKADRTIDIIKDLLVTYGVAEKITFTYTGEDVTATVNDGDGSVVTITYVDGVGSGEITVDAVKAGNQTITLTIPESDNYNSIEASVNVTTSLATGEIKVPSPEITLTYGDDPKDIEYEYAGNGDVTVESSDEDKVTVDIDEDNKVITVTPGNASDEEVTITIKSSPTEQFEGSETVIKVTVNPRPVSLTWSGDTFTYDGTEKEVTATVTNKVGNDTVDVTSYTDNKKTNANTYTAVATALSNTNYTLVSGENTTHDWVINRADINPTLTMEDYVYGGEKSIPSVSGNSGNGKETYYYYSGDDASTAKDWSTVTDSISLPAGEYKMYAVVDQTENYNTATTDTVTFLIIVGDMDIVFTENGEEYDNDWTNNDVVATITVPAEVTNLTAIHYRFEGDDTTYIVSAGSNTVEITFDENVNSKVYFVGVNVQGREVTAESVGYTLKIDKTKPVIGNVSVPTGKANTKDITVSNITDEGGSGIAGYYVSTDTNTTDATWTPFSGDSFTYTVSENDTYYVFVIDAAGNISEVTANTQVVVEDIVDKISNIEHDAEITVKVFETETPNITYSGEVKDIEYTITDTTVAEVDPDTGAVTGKASGDTTLKVTFTDYDGTVTEIEIIVNVLLATPELTLGSVSEEFVYGDANKTVTYTYTGNGTVSGETSNSSVATVESINNNTKVITINPGNVGEAILTITASETAQYESVSETINVKVTPRVIEVTWGEYTFTYDGTPKVITATIDNLVSGDSVNITYSGNVETNAGNYKAEVIGLSNSNYTIYGADNLIKDWVINKAERPVVVTPETQTAIFGDEPTITFTYSGEDTTATASSNNENVAKVKTYTDGNKSGTIVITTVGVGTANITVNVPETANYKAGTATASVTVERNSSADIDVIDPPTEITYGDAPVEIEYDYPGNGDVTVETSDGDVISAIVSGDKIIITPEGAGTTDITIKAEETDQYTEEEKTITITVKPRVVELDWDYETPFIYDTTEKKVTATVTNKVGADKVNVATYENNAKTDAGTYNAKALTLDNPNYTLEGTTNNLCTWEIKKADRVITMVDVMNIIYGADSYLNFTYTGEDVTATATIDSENYMKIKAYLDGTNSGEVTIEPVARGTSTITVTVPESANYNSATKTCTVTVIAADGGLVIENPDVTLTYGDNPFETTYDYFGNGEVTGESSNTNVATVTISSGEITITPGNAGTATITIKTSETEQYKAGEAEIKVTINPRPVILEWSEDTFTYDGNEKEITATVTNKVTGDTVNVTKYTNNKKTNAGNYTATATEIDNANYTLVNGQNISHNWVIEKADRTLTLNPDSITLEYGKNGTITYTYTGDVAATSDISVVSNATNIATAQNSISGNGGTITVTPVAQGTTKVVVTIAESTNYNAVSKECEVIIKRNSTEKVKVDTANQNISFTYGDSSKDIGYYYNGNGEITVNTTNRNAATAVVNANKTITITPHNAGTTNITINAAQTDQYEASSVTIAVTVNPKAVELTWSGDVFIYDGTEKEVTAKVTNAINGDIVNVIEYQNNKNTVVGEYTATATMLDNGNYTLTNGVNVSHDWEIQKAEITPTLTMDDYIYGGIKATPSVTGNPGSGEVTYLVYTGDNKASAINWNTVTSSTFLSPGTYKMYATIAETDNYKSGETNTVEFEITIVNVTVEITENGAEYTGEWTNNDVIATITVPESVTTMESVYYRVDGETELKRYDTTVENGNVVTITFNKDINKTIYFIAVDVAGRAVTAESEACLIRVDKSKPSIGKIEVPEGKANTKKVVLSEITDVGESGVVAYYIGTEALTDGVTWVELSGDSFKYEALENDTYYAYVKDAAGNISDVKTFEVSDIVDKVSNAEITDYIEIKVFESISTRAHLTFSGEPAEITYEVADENIATINPTTGTVKGLEAGETTITVTLRDYDGTVTKVTTTLKVNRADASITPSKAEIELVYGGSSEEATFTYVGDGTLNVSSANENVATVEFDGNNKITVSPVTAGTTEIIITATETTHYTGVTLNIPVTVKPRPVSLSWSEGTFTYDGTLKTVTAVITNLLSGDTAELTYEENEKTEAGSYVAVATSVSNPNYTVDGGTNINYPWVINKASRLIQIQNEIQLEYGTSGEVTFTYTGEDALANVSIANNIKDVAEISYTDTANGGTIVVTPVGAGTCKIVVNVPATDNYLAASAECTVTVLAIDPELTIEAPSMTLIYGDDPFVTKYTYTGNAQRAVIAVSDDRIIDAIVSGDEIIVTPKGVGTAKVILTMPATSQYNEITKEMDITVKPRPIILEWGQDEFVYDTTEKTIRATITNLVGSDVVNMTYSGNVERDVGEYVAEVIGLDNTNYTIVDGQNITHDWRIIKADRTLTVQDEITLEYGTSGDVQFTYTGEDVTAEVTITNETIAKIEYQDANRAGTVTVIPVGEGETTVTINVPESHNYNAITGSFIVKVNVTEPELSVDIDELTFTYGDNSKDVTLNYTGNGNVTVTSSNDNVVTGTVNGNKITVNPNIAGTAILTISTEKTMQYASGEITMNITVNPRPVELKWSDTIFAHDGYEKEVTAEVVNKVLGDTVTVTSYTGNKATEIGEYEAVATGLSNANYTLTGGINISTEWVIKELLPPDITVRQGSVIVPSGTWASGDVSVTIEPVEYQGVNIIYEYSFNGRDWMQYTAPFTYTRETEETIIYARAYNELNGIAVSLVGEYVLRLDKTDPDIKLENVSATGSVNGVINKSSEVEITLRLEDYVSGVEEGEFTADDIKVIAIHNGQTRELVDIYKVLTPDAGNATMENGSYKYTLTLKNLDVNGRLSLRIGEKVVTDRALRYNKAKTINLGLTADNVGPEVGLIKTSTDEYGRLFGSILDLEVTAKDDSGIKSYEWQVSYDGKTWTTFDMDETPAELSVTDYEATVEGMHHFRVIVTDIVGNSSMSQTESANINITINRKPTIRFETEQVSGTRVKIIAIIKSTKNIVSVKVNSSEIDDSTWDIVRTNNELTLTTEHIATANGTYVWRVEDEAGNVTTEEFNVTTIDDTAAVIVYETYDATEYALAKIVFEGSQEIRINRIITPDGTTTNILNPTDFTGMKFGTVDFSRKVSVTLDNMEFEKGTTFVFENKSFIETYVVVEKEIETEVMYVRTVSSGTKTFDEIFGSTFDINNAQALVNQMASKTKEISGKVNSYYGITGTPIALKVTEQDELMAVTYLGEASGILKLNQYGDPEKLNPVVTRSSGTSNSGYINMNITGVNRYSTYIINWLGGSDKNTFRITIRSK